MTENLKPITAVCVAEIRAIFARDDINIPVLNEALDVCQRWADGECQTVDLYPYQGKVFSFCVGVYQTKEIWAGRIMKAVLDSIHLYLPYQCQGQPNRHYSYPSEMRQAVDSAMQYYEWGGYFRPRTELAHAAR